VTEYERHEPEKTLLHRVVREQLEGFLSRSSLREHPTPRFVEQVLRAFLRSLFAELRRRARRIQRVIEARAADDANVLERVQPLLTLLAAASLRTRSATKLHMASSSPTRSCWQ